ncbi:hypothetical protein TcBrA4_0017930 [Trypanosoma cruzi]|nr:hypothetical protein TcBrA4_0017930 [Trypanosoma cruzi]
MHLRFNAPVSVVEDDEIREAPCHMRHGAAARRHSAVAAAAAAVAQANPLRATHAAAHHKMLPPLHGAPRACGSRAKSPRPVHPQRPASALAQGDLRRSKSLHRSAVRGHRLSRSIPFRVDPVAAVARAVPYGARLPTRWSHNVLGNTKHTYSHERRTQKRAYNWKLRERASQRWPRRIGAATLQCRRVRVHRRIPSASDSHTHTPPSPPPLSTRCPPSP